MVGLAFLASGHEEPMAIGAGLLGLSYVVARGAPWGDGSSLASPETPRGVSAPLLLVAAVLAAVAAKQFRDVAGTVSDVEGDVSSIMSDVSDLVDQRR